MTIDINGDVIDEITIDGEFTEEVTVDGEVVFQQSAIPDSGVSRWTWNTADISGSTLADSWDANDMTLNGVTTGASGANQNYNTNEAGSFNGTSDYAVVGSDLPSVFQGDFSIAFWAYLDSKTSIQSFVDYGDGTRTEWFQILYNDGDDTIRAQMDDGTNSIGIGVSAPAAGTWFHFVLTNDSAGDVVGYLNGTASMSTPSVGDPYDSTNDLWWGATEAEGRYLGGDIDDSRLYDKPLTSTEVSNLYNTGSI